MSMVFLLVILGLFIMIAVAGGMVAVFLLNRNRGERPDVREPLPRAAAAPALTGDVEADARALMGRSKIEAIKRVRDLTGWGLKEAKDYVDALERGERPPTPTAEPEAAPLAPEEMDDAARQLVRQGNKIQAIKLVREQTGWGLKEAKDYVDQLS